MTRVAVTGAAGKLGRACVADLLDHGYDVVAIDAARPADGRAPFVQVDLTDYGQTIDALTAIPGRYDGVDAIVHLAAIPSPAQAPAPSIFGNNAVASFNVFWAAKRLGIRNLVWASSETVLGLPFDEPPPYAPVDEACRRPETVYALVKLLEEEMAAQFCRWDPEAKMIGLRFSNVMEPHDYARFAAFDADARQRKWNLWAYIDARDGAQAVRKALKHDAKGCDVFVVANADTVMNRPNAELMGEVFPGVSMSRSVEPNETLLSIDKARRVLGFEPRFGWRSGAGG
jgi:nucleoside-diphosphate-sugar epimerase